MNNPKLAPIVTLKLELSGEATIKEIKARIEAIAADMRFDPKNKDDVYRPWVLKARVQRVDFD